MGCIVSGKLLVKCKVYLIKFACTLHCLCALEMSPYKYSLDVILNSSQWQKSYGTYFMMVAAGR